jgi:GLPGLI family protein
MKKITVILTIMLFSGNYLFAQHAHFTTSGKIQFDKNMNMFALMKKRINKDNEMFMQPAYESYIKNNPQFKILKSTESFRDNKTLFVPIEPENTRNNYFGDNPVTSQPNTIYSDYNTISYTAQKAVFEETFLVKDTVRKFKW